MSGINHLPLEIWLALSGKLLLCDFWSLLACGNRLLNNRLRHHAVVSHLQLDPTNKRQFTSFLAHGRLDKVFELSLVKVSSLLAQEVLSAPVLRSRFAHLRSLEFDHMPCELNMFAPGSQWASEAFSADGTLNLALLMPSLEHFCLSAADSNGKEPSLYNNLHLRILFPESLRSLEVYDVPELRLDALPPHLTKLHAPACSDFNELFVLSLPRTITSLELRVVDLDESWRFYQQAVTRLRVGIEHDVSDWLSRRQIKDILACNDPDWTSILPPNLSEELSVRLKDLHARRFEGIGCARHLPNLTHLGLCHRNWADDGTLDPLRLPDTLQTLRCIGSFGYPPEPVGRDAWPSHLKTLVFSAAQHLIASDLPPHVTYISNERFEAGSLPLEPQSVQSAPTTSENDTSTTELVESTRTTYAIAYWIEFCKRRGVGTMFDFSTFNGLHTILMLSSLEIPMRLDQVPLLPRTLTRLEWGFMQDDLSQVSPLEKRFPSLSLRLRGTPSSVASIKATEEESFWPPHLASLKFRSIPDFCLSLLPSSLTEYHILDIAFDSDLVYSIAKEMPEQLTRVTEAGILESSLALWQVSTRRFFVPSLLYTGDCLPHLHSITESLDLSDMKSFSSTQFHGFTRLHTITCDFGRCDISNARFLWQYLPPTLTSIHLNSTKLDIAEDFLLEMPSNVTKLKLAQFPRTLVSAAIMFPSGNYGTELCEETLEAAYNDFIASFGDRVEIGETIRDITLTPTDTLEGLPSNILSINLPTDTYNAHFYGMLPPSLTKLQLSRALLNDNHVPLLPASLTHLQIDEDMNISSDAMKLMPNLTTLKLRSNSRLTSECIPFLPATLTCLELHAAPFTDTHIDRLPAGLTDLDISWSSISQASLKLLPRGLTSLDIEHCELLETADPSSLPPNLTTLRAPPGMAERITSEMFPKLAEVEAPSGGMTGLFDF